MCPTAGVTIPEVDFSSRIRKHLEGWGLHSFSSEAAYYAWQRRLIPPEQLKGLADLARKRQGKEGAKWDLAFYDLAASPDILPVIYSQRYGYYQEIGLAVVQQLLTFSHPLSVLDVGCGVGILTTWYASVCPHMTFRGLDRSPQSIVAAKRHTARLNLSNVEFSCCTIPHDRVSGNFDLIIATQALFQSEVDPGLPSQSWGTFERTQDEIAQQAAEERTGLGPRLEGVLSCLKPQGVLLLVEKTLHLGRRVLFQRGLMRRGLSMVQKPRYLHYVNLGETEQEGPLYMVSRVDRGEVLWDEMPQSPDIQGLYRCSGKTANLVCSQLESTAHDESWSMGTRGQSIAGSISRVSGGLIFGCIRVGSSVRGVVVGGSSDEPAIREIFENLKDRASTSESFDRLCAEIWPGPVDTDPFEFVPVYENHSPAAQRVWTDLVGRCVIQSETANEEDGRAQHIEFGEFTGGWVYLYWANTYDQRQLVIMEAARKSVLLDYFKESIKSPAEPTDLF